MRRRPRRHRVVPLLFSPLTPFSLAFLPFPSFAFLPKSLALPSLCTPLSFSVFSPHRAISLLCDSRDRREKERARASERGCEVTRSRYGKRSVPFDRPAASSIFAVLTPKWIAFLGSVAARTSPSRLASRRRSIFSPTPSRKR